MLCRKDCRLKDGGKSRRPTPQLRAVRGALNPRAKPHVLSHDIKYEAKKKTNPKKLEKLAIYQHSKNAVTIK